ncbi:VIR protein [Plasmodium vivax]|uniref:(malaria parasite P. vivax) hypothetical protein n=1 Tax=Plasmodium vivax TaxID=5855 RepID=A0A1G4H7S5_PLAVI|nr:unnamed protein product [Plasmodium vivax]SCO70940.1 VIR protein [Plasmodium vivax]
MASISIEAIREDSNPLKEKCFNNLSTTQTELDNKNEILKKIEHNKFDQACKELHTYLDAKSIDLEECFENNYSETYPNFLYFVAFSLKDNDNSIKCLKKWMFKEDKEITIEYAPVESCKDKKGVYKIKITHSGKVGQEQPVYVKEFCELDPKSDQQSEGQTKESGHKPEGSGELTTNLPPDSAHPNNVPPTGQESPEDKSDVSSGSNKENTVSSPATASDKSASSHINNNSDNSLQNNATTGSDLSEGNSLPANPSENCIATPSSDTSTCQRTDAVPETSDHVSAEGGRGQTFTDTTASGSDTILPPVLPTPHAQLSSSSGELSQDSKLASAGHPPSTESSLTVKKQSLDTERTDAAELPANSNGHHSPLETSPVALSSSPVHKNNEEENDITLGIPGLDPEESLYKTLIFYALILAGFIMLCIILMKFTPLGGLFCKKKKKNARNAEVGFIEMLLKSSNPIHQSILLPFSATESMQHDNPHAQWGKK